MPCRPTLLAAALLALATRAWALAPAVPEAPDAPAAAAPAAADAPAASAPSGFDRELWVTTGFLSHHTGHSTRYHYNEHNDGLGLEWRVSPDWQFNAGHYRNSVRRGSTYFQAAWMPVEEPLGDDLRLRAGASLGLINGYPKVNHRRYFATLVPALSIETHRFGLNVVYIPSVGKKVDGAFALQLKVRVDDLMR